MIVYELSSDKSNAPRRYRKSSTARKSAQSAANRSGRAVTVYGFSATSYTSGHPSEAVSAVKVEPKGKRGNPAKAVRLRNFTGTIRVNPNKTVSVVGRKAARSNPSGLKTYEFWTDGGDESDIRAKSLQQAAEIASKRITKAQWADGAWGYVKGPDGRQMSVPSR